MLRVEDNQGSMLLTIKVDTATKKESQGGGCKRDQTPQDRNWSKDQEGAKICSDSVQAVHKRGGEGCWVGSTSQKCARCAEIGNS